MPTARRGPGPGGGRLVAITDLRYRHGGTRTMIPAGGRLAVAERTVRVHRPRSV
ncbi:hypothetical protein ACFXB3_12500 [Streptomyces sp. NPDC059447]|uniref:hypothetical protein n=1 Tax=Streptomyces sp. NPDC059447 TaxID=3346834 RepID=UPI003675FAC8